MDEMKVGDSQQKCAIFQSTIAELEAWLSFFQRDSHILQGCPNLLFQQMANQPSSTPAAAKALRLFESGLEQRPWLQWVNKPKDASPCLQTLIGQKVSCLAISNDRHTLVAGEFSGTLRVWDLQKGILLSEIETYKGPDRNGWGKGEIEALALIPGTPMVSFVADGAIRIWNLSSGCQHHLLCEGTGESVDAPILSGFIDSKGRPLTSDGVRVWDPETGELLHAMPRENGEKPKVASTDGRYFASVRQDFSLRVWDAATGAIVQTMPFCLGTPTALVVNDGLSKVITKGLKDSPLRIFTIGDGKPSVLLSGATGWVTASAVTADGSLVAAACSSDNALKIWSAITGETLASFQGHADRINSIKFDPSGGFVISGGVDRMIKTWQINTSDSTEAKHQGAILQIVVDSKETHAVSSGSDNNLVTWKLAHGEPLRVLKGHTGWISAIGFVPNSDRVISASDDGTIRIWSIGTGEEAQRLEHPEPGRRRSLAVSPDGKRLVSCTGNIFIWDMETGAPLAALDGKDSALIAIASPDGKRIIQGTYAGEIEIWDIETGKRVATLPGHYDPVTRLAMSMDGRILVSAGLDNWVHTWDTQSMKMIFRFKDPAPAPGHGDPEGPVIAVTAEGNRVIIGSLDGMLRFFDSTIGKQTHEIRSHAAAVISLAMVPGGRHVVSGSADLWIRVWDIATGELFCSYFVGSSIHALACTEELVLVGGSAGSILLLRLMKTDKPG